MEPEARSHHSELWRLFDEGAAKLMSMPAHGQFFTAPAALPAETLSRIEMALAEKLDARIAGFEKLVELVQRGGDPTPDVATYLGLAPST